MRPRKDWHYKTCECKRCERERSRSNWIQDIVTTAAIAGAVAAPSSAGDLTPGQGGAFDGNWAETSVQAEASRRSADMEHGTNDKVIARVGQENRTSHQ